MKYSTDINFLDSKEKEVYYFCASAHEGQKRKYTNEPYILHPDD